MKTFVVILQTSAHKFEKHVVKATSREQLWHYTRKYGVTVSVREFSSNNNRIADIDLACYNSL